MQTTAASAVWSPEEDEQLRRLVEQHGVKKWALIAKELQTKKSKQCRRRWKNYLDADLKTAPWTPEEDATLIKGQKLFGNKWTEIAKLVGGRTDNAVKNRWASLCKKSSSLGVSVSEAATGASGASSDDDEGAPASTQGRAASPQLRQASAAARAPPTAFPKRPRVSRPQRSESTERASAPEQWEIEDRAPEEAGRASPHPRLQRVGPPSFRHLSIAIPEPPDHPPADGSHNSARSGPLSIRVYRDSLSEGERQLAQELNCMAAPVQIVLEPRPMTWDSLASARAPPRSGHGATPEAGWETAARGDSSPSDIVRWLAMGTGHSPGFRPGLRSRLAPVAVGGVGGRRLGCA
ncbi:hypothetical protein WJX72_002681 [[Myrmecia] bisecta]|uniref:Uncharacterized protein n=1 Tax=[Myrmecia] bisecta TaxID=41462 RepID=A0AAW1QER0_9CHLO